MLLSYQAIGSNSDKPLVFLHGLGAGRTQTTAAFPDLPATWLVAPDMPGHGDSQEFDPADFSFDRFADHVIDLMDHTGIESCNIGGLSMGSGITLNLALRYPERVKKIILLRPSWCHGKQPDHLKLVAYVGRWIEELGCEEARNRLHTDPDFQSLFATNKPVAESIDGLFQRPVTPASTAVLYKMWQDAPFPSLESLRAISNPTLILTTGRDELHPQSTADLIASQLPQVISMAPLPPRYHEPDAYQRELNHHVCQFLLK